MSETNSIAAAVDHAASRLRDRRAELLDEENLLHEIDAAELLKRFVPAAPSEPLTCALVVTCQNAESSIGSLLQTLPRELPAVPTVEWIVVDDGSSDATTEVARRFGADHVIQFPQPRGPRATLAAGVDKALALNADFVVHVDSPLVDDVEIEELLRPLVTGVADCSVGEEPPGPLLPDGLRRGLLAVSRGFTTLANRPSQARRSAPIRALTREAALHLQPGDDSVDPIVELIDREGESLTVHSVGVAPRFDTEAEDAASLQRVPKTERFGRWSARKSARCFWGAAAVATIVAGISGIAWFAGDTPMPRTGGIALVASLMALQCCGFAILAENLKQQRRLMDDLRYRMRRAE